MERGCIYDNVTELLNKYQVCPASSFPVWETKPNNKTPLLSLLSVGYSASQDILIDTLSKNMSSVVMGIGSDATTEVQLDWMWRRETITWLYRESEKAEIKPRTLFYKAVYVEIKGVKSGFRKILAQILSLPFVSCEQVL